MPIVRIEMLAGRPPAVKSELIRNVTEAVVRSLNAPPEQVRVLLYEIAPEHWAVGGETKAGLTDAPAQPRASGGGEDS